MTKEIPDTVLFAALSSQWQTVNDITQKITDATPASVFLRMTDLANRHPHRIDADDLPMRWRLRGPKLAPVPTDIPPNAITNVRERIADASPSSQTFPPHLHHANCFDFMRDMQDASVDLVLTDPPYSTTQLDIDPVIDVEALWREFRRIVTPTGTIVMFGCQPFSSKLVEAALDLFKYDIVWIKGRATEFLNARNRPLKQHEDILIFSRGAAVHQGRTKRRYTYNALGQTEVATQKLQRGKPATYLRDFEHRPSTNPGTANNPRTTLFCRKDERQLHPFQKPLDLLEYLIRTYSHEGDVVLDPFMGSGSTCMAAMRSGRRSIGVEMDAGFYAVADERINPVELGIAA